MVDRDELTRRDADGWRAFEALLSAVPTVRRETPDLDDGWSVKDVLWHMGYWWEDFRRSVETGDWSEGEETTDEVNTREQEISRSKTWNEVRATVLSRREAMLAAWRAIPEVSEEVARSFLSETVEHYDEHRPQLRELLEADDE